MKLFLREAVGYPAKTDKKGDKENSFSKPVKAILPGRGNTGRTAWMTALLVGLLAAGIMSCTGHIMAPPKKASHKAGYKTKHAARHRPRHEVKYPPAKGKRPTTDAEVAAKLEQAWRSWRGTPHRLGGRDKRGIDCSGLVQVLYRELFGISLPRTVSAQVRVGRKVSRSDLRPGDLVFFRPPGKYRHVGIYMGSQRFLHTSVRHGVMVSRISDYYWKDCYWTARRHW